MRAVCAGIINTQTGEITHTVTIPREKNGLRSLLEDTLIPKHGTRVFQMFSFKTTPPPNWDLQRVKEALEANGIMQCLELDRLEYLHDIEFAQRNVDNATAELESVKATRDEALVLLVGDATKTEITKSAYNSKIEAAQSELDESIRFLQRMKKRLFDLEAALASE